MSRPIVKSLKYNFHLSGNTHDGINEDYYQHIVGEKGVTEIMECEPMNGNQSWNYIIFVNEEIKYRIFNPNTVEYFSLLP